jgi:AmpD protein
MRNVHSPRRLAIDAAGIVKSRARFPRPTAISARPASAITLIVVHGISLPPGEFGGDAIERFFTNQLNPETHPYFADIAARKVSAHFLIRRDGALIQFVAAANGRGMRARPPGKARNAAMTIRSASSSRAR